MIRVRIGADEHQLGWEEWEERVRSGRVPDDALVQFEAVTRGEWVPAAELEMYRSLRNDAVPGSNRPRRPSRDPRSAAAPYPRANRRRARC